LESNIGLNAIAQWTASLNTKMPQGLGTGSLFTNNIESPLVVSEGVLRYDNSLSWEYPF
ncbi:MAG: o-succinylbenzoate synthase, partial [Flavobacteriaceae bacterium]